MNDILKNDNAAFLGKELVVTFEDNRSLSLACGNFDQNIARMERRLGVAIHTNGNKVSIKGPSKSVDLAKDVLQEIYGRAHSGESLVVGDIDGIIEELYSHDRLYSGSPTEVSFAHISTRKRGLTRSSQKVQRVLERHGWL
jgi:phosphate starvation-inducible PhoH-like protein